MNTSPKYIELAPGLTICRALTGLWQIADLERDGNKVDAEQAALAMNAYAEAGFTTFDMADHYGSAEEISGVFKTKYSKGKAQLFTKWVPKPGPVTKQNVRDAVQLALSRLQSEQIELMQFHAWSYAHPSWLDCLFYLQELKEEGLIKNLGLTNFDTAHLQIVVNSGIDVVSNQVCYSLLDQRAAGKMSALCIKHNVKLLAFGTVAGGFLSEKWLNKSEPHLNDSLTWSQMKYKRFIDIAGGWGKFQSLLKTLDSIARKYNVGIANIASKYILENPAVAGVIIGARLGKSEHIQDNDKLFSFQFDEESKKQIAQSLSCLTTIPGDCGDEYRKPPFLTASGDLSHHVESFPAPYPSFAGSDGRTKALSGTMALVTSSWPSVKQLSEVRALEVKPCSSCCTWPSMS
jgi:aryl-alcohol dehydrogenase-like predicted oxidoreductase